MVCALCRLPSKIVVSHIIPKFVYKPMRKGGEKRFHELSSCFSHSIHRQDGFKEKLLCEVCEGKFGDWERYASAVIQRILSSSFPSVDSFLTFDDLKYDDFKLFQLSVLWRASVSNIDIFNQVDLGSHEEVIRLMLFNCDPGSKLDYPALMRLTLFDSEPVTDIFLQPVCIRSVDSLSFRFVFMGISWAYLVNYDERFQLVVQPAIGEDGRLVVSSGNLLDIDCFRSFISSHDGLLGADKIRW